MPVKFFQNQYFSCINCGKCCGGWDVPVTQGEKDKIEKLNIPGHAPREKRYFIKSGKIPGIYLIGKKGNHCVFLDSDNLCLIHKHHGEKAKPLACRTYPFDIFNWQDDVTTASLRYDCPAVASQDGRGISASAHEINSIAGELGRERKSATAEYSGKLKTSLKNIRIVADAYRNFILDPGFRPSIRIFAAAKLLEFHSRPENSSDITEAADFFSRDAAELVKRSVPALENIISEAGPPNFHQKMVFRYILSGFMRSDEENALKFRPAARLSRVKSILKFSLGSGSLDKISGKLPDTSCSDPMESVRGMEWDENAFAPYWNYLGSKLDSLHFCGYPCLNLSFEEGMRHLLMTYPALAYLSALLAKSDKRKHIRGKDVAEALSLIDHTFSRSPFFAIRHVRRMTRSLCSENTLAPILKPLP
ncbi:MAG: YkgJ family cysteine cluster protein [Victivallales bacterium]